MKFKAFIFSIRSNIYNFAPSGWTIIEPGSSWLGELVAEPSSIFDSFNHIINYLYNHMLMEAFIDTKNTIYHIQVTAFGVVGAVVGVSSVGFVSGVSHISNSRTDIALA